jgi:hypothetical protein
MIGHMACPKVKRQTKKTIEKVHQSFSSECMSILHTTHSQHLCCLNIVHLCLEVVSFNLVIRPFYSLLVWMIVVFFYMRMNNGHIPVCVQRQEIMERKETQFLSLYKLVGPRIHE